MSIKCQLGFHSWDGCKCTQCSKTRDEQHDWTIDCQKCSKCGKIRDTQHKWITDCEKCSECGKIRENQHDWTKDCEMCSKCNKTLRDVHVYVNSYCTKCGIQEGLIIDERDGKKYKTVKIGTKTILAENFSYKPSSGNYWVHGNNPQNITKYGYLYDWKTANAIAPRGWHLPSKEEWESLFKYLGNDNKSVFNALKEGGSSGFNALLCGVWGLRGWTGNDYTTAFWSSTLTERGNKFKIVEAWGVFSSKTSEEEMHSQEYQAIDESVSNLGRFNPEYGYSVRLFRD